MPILIYTATTFTITRLSYKDKWVILPIMIFLTGLKLLKSIFVHLCFPTECAVFEAYT